MSRPDFEILQNNQADMVKSIKDYDRFVQGMKTNEKSNIQEYDVNDFGGSPHAVAVKNINHTYSYLTCRLCRHQYET